MIMKDLRAWTYIISLHFTLYKEYLKTYTHLKGCMDSGMTLAMIHGEVRSLFAHSYLANTTNEHRYIKFMEFPAE